MDHPAAPEVVAALYSTMSELADHDGNVRMSQVGAAERLGCSKTNAVRALHSLRVAGAVSIVRMGTSNRYPTVWHVHSGWIPPEPRTDRGRELSAGSSV